MKFQIGQPVQTKGTGKRGRYKWKGYIMWYFPDIDEYLVSCANYTRPSHYGRYSPDALEERIIPKSEIPTQQAFRKYMETLWADRQKLSREHSCKGCKMITQPRDRIIWHNNIKCRVKGIRLGKLELYPFRNSRCLLRCETKEQAKELEKRLIEKGR